MITIKIKPKENINRALSRFKAAVMNEGIMKAVRDKSHFVKPCLKRKLKREEAQRQRVKDEMKLIRQIENEQNEWRRR
jgi:ribosomal protein S21|tara:strand:- start:295 stop:528 length:234 start_codon:yes stop_codon:yes gene_type:complete